jgi:hypothetical protein
MKAPNIPFLMAEQWRWDWLGYMGAGFVRTPHLDRLAGPRISWSLSFSPPTQHTPA